MSTSRRSSRASSTVTTPISSFPTSSSSSSIKSTRSNKSTVSEFAADNYISMNDENATPSNIKNTPSVSNKNTPKSPLTSSRKSRASAPASASASSRCQSPSSALSVSIVVSSCDQSGVNSRRSSINDNRRISADTETILNMIHDLQSNEDAMRFVHISYKTIPYQPSTMHTITLSLYTFYFFHCNLPFCLLLSLRPKQIL